MLPCSLRSYALLGFVFSLVTLPGTAFQFTRRIFADNHYRIKTKRNLRLSMAAVDPTDFVNVASVIHHPSNHVDLSSLETVLSMLSVADGVVKPAHGHSQPLFGPLDPYLSNGHSIAPNLKSVLGGDFSAQSNKIDNIETLPEAAQIIARKGGKIIDISDLGPVKGSVLPGFTRTAGIFPQYPPSQVGMDEGYKTQVLYSATFFRYLEKLPLVAFVYVFIDFFFIRPGIVLYKEEIEDEPIEVAAETADAIKERLVVFSAIALVSYIVFLAVL